MPDSVPAVRRSWWWFLWRRNADGERTSRRRHHCQDCESVPPRTAAADVCASESLTSDEHTTQPLIYAWKSYNSTNEDYKAVKRTARHDVKRF